MGDFITDAPTRSHIGTLDRYDWVCECEFVCLIGSNLSSTGAMPSSPVRSFRLISSICSCTEMKRVKKKKRNEANLDIRPFYINENFDN